MRGNWPSNRAKSVLESAASGSIKMQCQTHSQLLKIQRDAIENLHAVAANKGDTTHARKAADDASDRLTKHIASCSICSPGPETT